MHTHFPFRALAACTAIGMTALSAACGIWVAAAYEGGTPALLPFAFVAGVGVVLAVIGLWTRRPVLIAAGMMLQVFSPSGFAWLASVAIALLGAALLTATLRRRAPGM